MRIARAFAPILKANGGGAIVNIHSVLSWLGGAGAYGASKAAIWSVSNTLRLELEAQHTHVLGVHAAFIDTDMVSALPVPKTPPRHRSRWSKYPIRRTDHQSWPPASVRRHRVTPPAH
ncbi:oxidoreductase [Mycobacteroides abscessus subsp. abscessus]|nr:oxidoreductase [Mycobacteroides abscessus subsp. abscessus]